MRKHELYVTINYTSSMVSHRDASIPLFLQNESDTDTFIVYLYFSILGTKTINKLKKHVNWLNLANLKCECEIYVGKSSTFKQLVEINNL